MRFHEVRVPVSVGWLATVPIEPFALSLLGRILARLLSSPIGKWLAGLKASSVVARWWPLYAYRRSLPEKLRRMPFIYAGIETDILNDFVDIELDRLNPSTLEAISGGAATHRVDPWRMLTDRKYCAIVGGAGIGKTTFQRHSMLEVLNDKAKFLFGNERPLPVYIPLKVVANSGPFPILRYLRNAEPFLGDAGYLMKMTQTRGLFLCLDGYDEIAQTGTEANYIQKELEFIAIGKFSRKHRDWAGAYSETDEHLEDRFYETLARTSRVWLTSRPQFIQHHPIGPIGDRTTTGSGSFATIGIIGIGQNRESLVRRVFARYSSTHIDVGSLLDAEFFLQYIDRAEDLEIREMSFNPLFLTVMCYNYAQTVLQEGRHDVALGNSFDLLIVQCINLLLLDLDEYKARQFTAVQKHAIENRRNQFVAQKKAFLQYLAGRSYLENVSVFTEHLLQEWLFTFLEGGVEERRDIEKTFEAGRSDRPTFVRQLIYCGIFVLVDTSKASRFYDFPHRRFREVLATNYFAEPSAYVEFVAQVAIRGRSSVVELITVLLRSAVIREAHLQRLALRTILDGMLANAPGDRDYRQMTEEYARMLPTGCDVSDVIETFLLYVKQMRKPQFECSARVLLLREVPNAYIQELEQYVRERCTAEDDFGAALGCSVLSTYAPQAACSFIGMLLRTETWPEVILAVLMRALLDLDLKEGRKALMKCVEGRPRLGVGLRDAVCTNMSRITAEMLRAIQVRLDPPAAADLIVYMASLSTRAADATTHFGRLCNYELAGVLALRAQERIVQIGHSSTLFLSYASITAIIATAMDLLRLIDAGKIGDAGPHDRAMAIRELKPDQTRDLLAIGKEMYNYAAVPELQVALACAQMKDALEVRSNQFVPEFAPIESAINCFIATIFQKAVFRDERQVVAFAVDDSFVFTRDSLGEVLKSKAFQLTAWKSDVVDSISEAWMRMTEPLDRVPQFFSEVG